LKIAVEWRRTPVLGSAALAGTIAKPPTPKTGVPRYQAVAAKEPQTSAAPAAVMAERRSLLPPFYMPYRVSVFTGRPRSFR
jgi:hypothetical protein